MFSLSTTNRRSFLKTTVGAGVAGMATQAMPSPVLALVGNRPEAVPPLTDPRLKELTNRALDAARSANATYADVRLTHTKQRRIQTPTVIGERESITAGVRVLLNGYWGFAASPIWSPDEMVRLAREAASIAKTNALGKTREVSLAPIDTVRDGRWIAPCEVDPFTIYPPEIMDYLLGLTVEAKLLPFAMGSGATFMGKVQDKAFAATSGSYITQRTYIADYALNVWTRQYGNFAAQARSAGGLERMQQHDLLGDLRRSMDRIKSLQKMPVKPLDVGRYDTVFDAGSIKGLLSGSIGYATELDRALGYEANAGGTSYLSEPQEMRGTFKLGSPLLNVTANRTDPNGLATVKWDDEGVETTDFPLVTEGVVVDYQTNREGAGWLSTQLPNSGTTYRSNGCAAAPDAIHAPLVHTANLVMTPGKEAIEEEDLLKSVKKGIAFRGLSTYTDFQQSGGIGTGGIAFEVLNGKRTAILPNAGILFRSNEFWKNLIAIGGATSVKRDRNISHKGEPERETELTVSTVPVLIKDATVIDYRRKA